MSDSGRSQSDLAIFKRVMRDARPYWGVIGLYLVIGLLATPLSLLTPLPLKIVTDSVIGDEPLPSGVEGASTEVVLAFAVVLLIVVSVLKELQSQAYTLTHTYTSEKLILGLRARIMRHAQRLSVSYHDAKGTADSTYRMMWDASAIGSIAIDGLVPIVIAVVTASAMLLVILSINATIGAIAILITPPLMLSNRTYRRRIRPGWRRLKRLEILSPRDCPGDVHVAARGQGVRHGGA